MVSERLPRDRLKKKCIEGRGGSFQDGPKMGPRWPKMAPNWFQVGEEEVKMGKMRPKRPRSKHVQKPYKLFYRKNPT